MDRAQPALRLLRRLRAPEQQRLAQRVHVSERRAELVRHRGDERPARFGKLVLPPQSERRGRREPEAEEQHTAEHESLATQWSCGLHIAPTHILRHGYLYREPS